MKNSIVIKNLNKKYPNFELKNINLTIPSGCIVGLIGENGAGKTTLIKSLLNIININNGTIELFNKNSKENEVLLKREIGVVLDDSFFPEILKIDDIKNIMQNIYDKWDNDLFDKYLHEFKLKPNQNIKTLSKGMKKKLEIAVALSHNPKLLILDEPTSGLDPVVRSEILDIFLDFIKDDDHTILLSTHITSDLEHIADYIVFINNGEIVFDKNRDDILDNYGIIKCDEEGFKNIDSKDILKYKKNKYNYEILVDDRSFMKSKYKDLLIDKATLEDIMVLYIKGVK